MTYEVLVIIVVMNAIVTLSLWRKVASKSKREGSRRALARRADHTQTRSGRPKGSRNATTIALETLYRPHAKGDRSRLGRRHGRAGPLLDRILPPRKDRPVTFALPPIESAKDAAATVSAVLAAVAAGDLTPADAGEISKLIETYVRRSKQPNWPNGSNGWKG
jgi:hypothetical protein